MLQSNHRGFAATLGRTRAQQLLLRHGSDRALGEIRDRRQFFFRFSTEAVQPPRRPIDAEAARCASGCGS